MGSMLAASIIAQEKTHGHQQIGKQHVMTSSRLSQKIEGGNVVHLLGDSRSKDLQDLTHKKNQQAKHCSRGKGEGGE